MTRMEEKMLKMFRALTRDEKDYLEDFSLCGTLSFKWILRSKNGWLGLDLSALIFKGVAGFCEHNNETLIL